MLGTGLLFLALASGSFAAAEGSAAPAAEGAPRAPAAKTKILVLDLDASGLEPAQAELIGGVVAQTLAGFDELEVVTTGDIRRVADFEAQKQALGCDEQSCLAEIAGAMGAQYVIFGRVGTLDKSILAQLNLFDVSAARPVAREDVRSTSLDDLVDRTGPATLRLARTLLPEGAAVEASSDAPTAEKAAPGPLTPVLRWGGAGLAGLGLTVGAVASLLAVMQVGVVQSEELAAKARNDGKLLGATMVITAGVSGAVAALGLGAFGASFLDLE